MPALGKQGQDRQKFEVILSLEFKSALGYMRPCLKHHFAQSHTI